MISELKETIDFEGKSYTIFSLKRLEGLGVTSIHRLPFSIRVMLENLLRNMEGEVVTVEHVKALASLGKQGVEIAFHPARVILQDFTGVPCVVDLASMRDAMVRMGKDPEKVNPLVPVDLVIDHSIQVDHFGSHDSKERNMELEYRRNVERYTLLKWAQKAFSNMRIFPPGSGIIHQVNLEFISKVVIEKEVAGENLLYPETLIGTDSHTTMINALGVLGWGVGGIEAEAVMLGQPYYMMVPDVIGVRLTGKAMEGVTTTDIVLTITELLRKHGVVGKFVEFFGPAIKTLSIPERATISNMAPEYGATVGFFPVDRETINYLRKTARGDIADLVEVYSLKQGLFYHGDESPMYSEIIEFDISMVRPCISGPSRPQDRIPLAEIKKRFPEYISTIKAGSINKRSDLSDGSIVIAAITSCTNTSNPSVMMGAGLLAKKAVERGLSVKPHVKTSLAPGSRVVYEYLETSGLLQYLKRLNFYIVGFGCTTCIGNSGDLSPEVEQAIRKNDLIVSAVLSGNRNFEARIHPSVRTNYLASPMLVIAYAIAGRIDIDLMNEPLGIGSDGRPVYLREIWPSREEIQEISRILKPDMFSKVYSDILNGDDRWQSLPESSGKTFKWDEASTYIKNPPFFDPPLTGRIGHEIRGARVLAVLGDSVTTDHISPAGAIPPDYPAGRYLIERGVEIEDFNTYGSRRGNHEVMMRGTFANLRLRNRLVAPKEGGYTIKFPQREEMFIYDAAMRYKEEGIPLIILAGREYGTGSSRDWAAKGTRLLGVRAVIAESFERIHRSNLVGMGVLPLCFMKGEGVDSLGIKGDEEFYIYGLEGVRPRQKLEVIAIDNRGKEKRFNVITRLDTWIEVEYFKSGGILSYVLKKLAS